MTDYSKYNQTPCMTRSKQCRFSTFHYNGEEPLYNPAKPEKDWMHCDLTGEVVYSGTPTCTCSDWEEEAERLGASGTLEKYLERAQQKPSFCASDAYQCKHATLAHEGDGAFTAGGPRSVANDRSEAHYYCHLVGRFTWGETPCCSAADWEEAEELLSDDD